MYKVQVKNFFGKVIMSEEFETKEEAEAVYDEQEDACNPLGETTVILFKNNRAIQSNKSNVLIK